MSLFTSIKCIGGRIDYPFKNRGDTTTKIYILQCICDANVYAPAADDDTMTNAASAGVDVLPANFVDALAYWVGDSEPTQYSGPLVKFDRTFANVPAARVDPVGLYAFTRPGIDQGLSGGGYTATWQAASSSKNYSNAPVQLTATIAANRIQNYAVGQSVDVINNSNWSVVAGGTISANRLRGEIFGISVNTITVRSLALWTGSSFTVVTSINSDSGSIYTVGRELPDREAESVNVAAFASVSYVRSSAPESLPLSAKLEPINADGQKVNQLRNTSEPTISDFLDSIQDGDLLEIENETINEWRGNIYQKSQIKGRLADPNV